MNKDQFVNKDQFLKEHQTDTMRSLNVLKSRNNQADQVDFSSLNIQNSSEWKTPHKRKTSKSYFVKPLEHKNFHDKKFHSNRYKELLKQAERDYNVPHVYSYDEDVLNGVDEGITSLHKKIPPQRRTPTFTRPTTATRPMTVTNKRPENQHVFTRNMTVPGNST